MKRVLQITRAYYPRIGGIEQVTRDIVHALNGMDDMEQKVICLGDDGADGELVRKRSQSIHDMIDGTEIIRCGSICQVASQLLSPSYPFELHRVMKTFQPDIVIFHYPSPFMAAFLLAYKKQNFKLIIYWHLDITRQKLLGKLFHRQNLSLLQRADIVAPTSMQYIEGSRYLQQFRSKCQILCNCIDTTRLQTTERTTVLADRIRNDHAGKIICFALGRHVPYKGYKFLIQAADDLDDRFRIFIGGTGPLTEELKKQASGNAKVIFPGRISDEEMVAYYQACDIFCFPSVTKNEAFGIALAEGMYFGKPAVTFTIPGSGVNFVSLNGVTGIECPNGDNKAYAEALRKLADDPALREKYGKNARQRVLENFTTEQFQQSIRGLLEMLKNQGVRPDGEKLHHQREIHGGQDAGHCAVCPGNRQSVR